MIRRTLIAALWFLVAFAVRADDTLQNYDVELLIFRLVKPAVTAENWALEQTQDHAASNGAGDGEDTPIT
ncbi:MAG TPA: hypothetical protein VET48_03640, partial [Steroidobacteraceae bacterium]|nr:hypothetical protein [Steroidobacteraceae bacterium]